MPYVSKEQGVVTGLFARPQFEGQEFLADTAKPVVDFHAQDDELTVHQQVRASDREMKYVAEDLLHVLLTKGFLVPNDFTPEQMSLLDERRALRGL